MHNKFVWRVALFASLGTFNTGYIVGLVNGIIEMEGFQATFSDLYGGDDNQTSEVDNDTSADQRTCSSGNGATSALLIGLIVSAPAAGGVIGCLLAGWLGDKFGRKYGLFVIGVLVSIGSTLVAASFHIWLVIVGVFVTGITGSATFVLVPLYISEMSPKQHRGTLSSLAGFGFSFGFVFSLCCNIGYSRFFLGWRVTAIVLAVLGAAYSIGMLLLPRTPRWLAQQGREKEALLILSRINSHSKKEDTLSEMEDLKNSTGGVSARYKIRELFKRKYRLLMSSTLQLIEGANGIVFTYYATAIFCQLVSEPFVASLILGIIAFTAAITLTGLIDRVGRKTMLLGSTLVMTFLGLAAAILLQLFRSTSGAVPYIVVALICAYVYFYSTSWIVVPTIYSGEIFPVDVRGFASAIAVLTHYITQTVVNQMTPLILVSPIRIHGYLYIITGINIAAIIFITLAMPESKGVSLEHMDQLFEMKWVERIKIRIDCDCNTSKMEQTPRVQECVHSSRLSFKNVLAIPDEIIENHN